MWTIFCNGSDHYRLILFPELNLRYFYGIIFKKEQNAIYVNGIDPKQYHEFGIKFIPSYAGHEEDWDTYYRQFYSGIGWKEDAKNGISDSDERLKKIISDPKIKELINNYLYKYRYIIVQNIFSRK